MVFSGQQNMSDEDGSTSEDLEDDVQHNGKQSHHGDDSDQDDSNTSEEEGAPSEVNFDEEADIARKVLKNLITSSTKGISENDDSSLPKKTKESKSNKDVNKEDKKSSKELEKVTNVNNPEILDTNKLPNPEQTDEENDDLQRTIFINNLPFDCNNEEVKQRFSGFGEVEYFAPVLHQVTKYVLNYVFLMCVRV